MFTSAILSGLVGMIGKLGLGFFADRDKARQQAKSIEMMTLEIADNAAQRDHDLAMAAYMADREDNRVRYQADVDLQISQDQLIKQNIINSAAPIQTKSKFWMTFIEVFRSTLRPTVVYTFLAFDAFLMWNFLYADSSILTEERFTELLVANIDLMVMVVSFYFTGRLRP